MDAFPEHHLSVNNTPKQIPSADLQPHQTEYQRYRQSPRWRKLSLAVCMRAKGKCEICLRANGVETAHLTYERIFNERMTDLLWVCKKCHRDLDISQQM